MPFWTHWQNHAKKTMNYNTDQYKGRSAITTRMEMRNFSELSYNVQPLSRTLFYKIRIIS